MSTMKVTNLKHESSSVNNIVLNSDGSVGGELATTLASKLDLAGGKILQIVREVDTTERSTNSTSASDVTGMSVTITPQKSDSMILVRALGRLRSSASSGTNQSITLTIRDSDNNALSAKGVGPANYSYSGTATFDTSLFIQATVFPATTSPVTYKLSWNTGTADTTAILRNNLAGGGEMFAIEVSA